MLTAKQKTFCEEYLVDLNATQAAIRAGYSSDTAQQIGSENLLKPVIQEHIQKNMDKRSQKTEITAEYVLNGIRDVVATCVEEDTYDAKAALKGYELLGKHLKIFTEVHENTHKFVKMGEVSVGKDGDQKQVTDQGDTVEGICFEVGNDAPEVKEEDA